MDIYEELKMISSQQDFIDFIKFLQKDFKNNPDDWENDDILNFLSGMEGYTFDKKIEHPSWKDFAEILLAARVYE